MSCALFSLALLLAFFTPLLVAEKTLVHDNMYWNFPVFHYFVRCLSQGILPLWNPYDNAGQPFYPLLLQFRLLDPIPLLMAGLGALGSFSTTFLFNLCRIVQVLVLALGTYLSLRPYTRHLFTRLSLQWVLLFSSFLLGSFQQDGILSQFYWAPWIFLGLRKIFWNREGRPWIYAATATGIGLHFQSYHFVGIFLFLSLFALAMLVFNRDELAHWKSQFGKKEAVSFLIPLLLLAAPNASLFLEKDRYEYPLRSLPPNYQAQFESRKPILPGEGDATWVKMGLKIPLELFPYTAASSKPIDFLQALAPLGNGNLHGLNSNLTWGNPSEAYIYIGVLPWILGFFGFFLGKGLHKRFWATLLLGSGLLAMGPAAGIHRWLYEFVPPLWYLRHTQCLIPFFLFSWLYFVVLGWEWLWQVSGSDWAARQSKRQLVYFMLLTGFYVLAGRICIQLDYQRQPPTLAYSMAWILMITALITVAAIRFVSRQTLAFSFIAAQVLLLLSLDRAPGFALAYLIAFGAFPVWLFLKKRAWLPLVGFLLLSDLVFSFSNSERVYNWQPALERLMSVKPTLAPFSVPATREPAPDYPRFFRGNQSPRYLGLLQEKPFALSGAIYFKEEIDVDFPKHLELALTRPRWNTYLLLPSYVRRISQKEDLASFANDFAIGKPIFSTPSPVQARFVSPNEWELKYESPTEFTFEWKQNPDPSWTATLDGHESLSLVPQAVSSLLSLPNGTHRVVLKYEPKNFLWSIFLFYCGIAFSLALATTEFLKGKVELFARNHRELISSPSSS